MHKMPTREADRKIFAGPRRDTRKALTEIWKSLITDKDDVKIIFRLEINETIRVRSF